MLSTRPLRPGGLNLTKHAVSFCHFSAGDILIDVGCGQGQSVDLLRQCGFCVFGIDIQHSPHIDCQAHAAMLPLQKQSVHGILSECVVSLLSNPQEVFKHWWQVCKDNGYLLIHDVFKTTKSIPSSSSATLCAGNMERHLDQTGWKLLHREDCSQHMKSYAAQLLWHGASCAELEQWQHCGYELWIAQKINTIS